MVGDDDQDRETGMSAFECLREACARVDSRTLSLDRVKRHVIKKLRKIRFCVAGNAKTGSKMPMTRSEVLLAILAASQGRPYTPVQIQKAAFLVTRNLPDLVDDGSNFEFEPYDYGPFDHNVYGESEALNRDGMVEIIREDGTRWNRYAASDAGVNRGADILARMSDRERSYVAEVSAWVRAQSFESLVRSIYSAYPEMRVNSVFRG
jgi:hypothetical protein